MYPIAHDLATAVTAAVRKVGLAKTVVVEQSPDWPGELIFQAGDAQGFYDRFGDWISRYLVLNQLFALRSFHDLIVGEGWLPIYEASCEPILERFESWDDPLTIEGFDCPYGGELYPFQTFTLNRALHRALWGKTAQERLFFCNWTTGSGKAQPLSEPVLTPGGWWTMKDLYVGAQVIGSDGKPTRVLAIHPQGVQPVYRVEFNDGTFTRCNGDHLWTVRQSKIRYRKSRGGANTEVPWKTLTTREIAKTLPGRGWQLPILAPIQGDSEGNLLMDPYALGVFLGDGGWAYDQATVSTDRWIGQHLGWHLQPAAEAKGHEYHTRATVPSVVRNSLKTMGLGGLGSHRRFIPGAFLRASISERLALLQGLLDTDAGNDGKKSTIEYSTTSPELRDGVTDLIRSLGGRATVSPGRITKYTNTDGERVPGRESWRIHLSLPEGMDPFRLPRKLDTWVRPTKYQPTKVIHGIVEEGVSEKQRCITVEASDNLYVTRGHALTHNSLFATAGAQELFNRGAIDLVCAFTLMASKENLATDAVASFAKTTNLRAVVNDGDKRKRQAVYAQEAKGYRNHPQVFVLNYEKSWADFEELKKLVKGRRVLWVFDEAAKVLKATGPPTKTRAHLMKLVRASQPIVWPMSATVVDASPLRYWDVYNLTGRPQETNPLGDRTYFKTRYSRFASPYIPDDEIEWSAARLHEIRHKVADRTQAVRKTDPGVREHFKGMQHEETTIHLSAKDRELYEIIVADAQDVIDETPDGERPKIGGHARLLQYVCNIPTALNVSTDEAAVRIREAHPDLVVDTHCAKLEYFLDQVEAIRDQGDKVVAFTRYTNLGMLLMAPHVAKRGIDHVLHYGVGQKPHERQAAQQRFKTDPRCTLFLSSDAGSHGLNLPEARYVINYDCPRSYDLLMQRSERINRADSQLDGMTSYVYLTEGTLEDLIWEENVRRRLLASATMGTVETLDYGALISEDNDPHRLIFGKKAS